MGYRVAKWGEGHTRERCEMRLRGMWVREEQRGHEYEIRDAEEASRGACGNVRGAIERKCYHRVRTCV